MIFRNRSYLSFLRQKQRDFFAAGQVVTHDAYGFPLSLFPTVYPADPAFTHSASIVIANLPPDLTGCDMLDVGTGTGVIAIAAARRGARVTALDNDPDAVAAARANVAANGLSDRVAIVESDLFQELDAASRFDLVTANLWFPIRYRGFDHDHAEMLAICARFVNGVGDVLRPGGTAMLASGAFADARGIRRLFKTAGIVPERTTLPATYDGGRRRMDWHLYRFAMR